VISTHAIFLALICWLL